MIFQNDIFPSIPFSAQLTNITFRRFLYVLNLKVGDEMTLVQTQNKNIHVSLKTFTDVHKCEVLSN